MSTSEFKIGSKQVTFPATKEVDGVKLDLNVTALGDKVVSINGRASCRLEDGANVEASIGYNSQQNTFGISLYGVVLAKIPEKLLAVTLQQLNELCSAVENGEC